MTTTVAGPRVQMIKPAIYKIPGLAKPYQNWGWVNGGDLMGTTGLKLSDILAKFAPLDDKGHLGQLHVVGSSALILKTVECIRHLESMEANLHLLHIPRTYYFPAGWASDIPQLHQRFDRVEICTIPREDLQFSETDLSDPRVKALNKLFGGEMLWSISEGETAHIRVGIPHA